MRATGMNSASKGPRDGVGAAAVIGNRAKAVAVAAAGQADLAENGGKHGAHPDRLLAVFGALNRVREHDQRASSLQPPRQRTDCVGAKPGDPRRPCSVLRLAVC